MVMLIAVLIVLFAFNYWWDVSVRFTWVFALLVGCVWITNRRVHWSDRGMYDELGVLILTALACIPFVVFAARWGIAAMFWQTRKGPFWIDMGLAAATGAFVIAALFRSAAIDAAGVAQVWGLHLSIAVVCLGLLVWAVRLRGEWAWALGGAGASGVVLCALSGLWFPQMVMAKAEAWAQGAPYIITSGGQPLPPAQLTFLTMPKNQWNPHAVLSFETDSGTCHAAWSYGYRTFRTDNWLVDSSACPSLPD